MKDKKVQCPVCKKGTAWKDNPFRPFCSDRCRLMDLGKWASEEYRIAGGKISDAEEEEEREEKKDGLQ